MNTRGMSLIATSPPNLHYPPYARAWYGIPAPQKRHRGAEARTRRALRATFKRKGGGAPSFKQWLRSQFAGIRA